MARRYIQIHGHRLYLEERGPAHGAPVLLLHHGLGSLRAWREQVPALAAAGLRVIAYDRWGYGKSDARPALSLPTFEDDQCDLKALLDELGIAQAAFIGHSDGGTLALHFAINHPQRVNRLVTLAAHVFVEPKMISGIWAVRQAFENDADFRRRFRRVHGDKFEQVFQNWFNGWARPANQDWDMRPLLQQVGCPSLVVQGLEDEHANPQHAMDIAAAIPGAVLWLAPDAGHMLQKDAADPFNQKVLVFLLQGLPLHPSA